MIDQGPDMNLKFIFSFHDLCPETLPRAMNFLTMLADHGQKKNLLLIIPGLFKDDASIDELKKLLQKFPETELAGHGWTHKIIRKTSIYHYIHSIFISRGVGEHLSLSETEIFEIINSCHGWFIKHDLPTPKLYVPPAWAMGRIRRNVLDNLPFRYYEYQSGIYDRKLKQFKYIPVIGFEADTLTRQIFLTGWNYINMKISRYLGSVRVAVHPFDLELKLSNNLKETIQTGSRDDKDNKDGKI